MDSILNGPLGQIAGIALEKLCNSPRLSESEKIQAKYNAIEAHFQGVSKILKPAVNFLVECKSADRARSERHLSSTSINYYTPQKQSNNCVCNQRYDENYPSRNHHSYSHQLKEECCSEMKNISWKTCDACQAVSKFLIPTSCDHEICQKCIDSGKDCQKCLSSIKKIKSERM